MTKVMFSVCLSTGWGGGPSSSEFCHQMSHLICLGGEGPSSSEFCHQMSHLTGGGGVCVSQKKFSPECHFSVGGGVPKFFSGVTSRIFFSGGGSPNFLFPRMSFPLPLPVGGAQKVSVQRKICQKNLSTF